MTVTCPLLLPCLSVLFMVSWLSVSVLASSTPPGGAFVVFVVFAAVLLLAVPFIGIYAFNAYCIHHRLAMAHAHAHPEPSRCRCEACMDTMVEAILREYDTMPSDDLPEEVLEFYRYLEDPIQLGYHAWEQLVCLIYDAMR